MAIYGYLGDIPLGETSLTGPTRQNETLKASLPEHKLARGKPAVQDTGDDLDVQALEFFFDETFCDPETEMLKIRAAFRSRTPLALVKGYGGYAGIRYVVEELDIETMKTTPSGRATRYRIVAKLKEAPIANPLEWLGSIARMSARGLIASATENPEVKS